VESDVEAAEAGLVALVESAVDDESSEPHDATRAAIARQATTRRTSRDELSLRFIELHLHR
jgi:hypothetical protein